MNNKEKYRVPYGYFLNRVFNHFKVVYEKGAPGTVKQMVTLNIKMSVSMEI